MNDTIMGGNSRAEVRSTPNGIFIEGNLVEENGGFISCRSPIISPPLNLSNYQGLELRVKGNGWKLKFAVSSSDQLTSFTELFTGGLRWTVEFDTDVTGITVVQIPFSDLQPSIRAKAVPLPLTFNKSCIDQLQLLYSKFGVSGNLNSSFKTGEVSIFLESISAY